MKMEHRPGYLRGNADGLSRRPWPENPASDILGEVQNFCEPLVAGATTSDGSFLLRMETSPNSDRRTNRGLGLTFGPSSQRISN